MDGITPVGAEVAPIHQSNPLQTYAGILGIQQQQVGLQQQQQNLETGRYQQQQQQSAAQSQQEQMQERMKLQQAMQSGVDDEGNSLKGPDGEFNPQALTAFANRSLPLIGQDVVQSVLKTQSDKVALSGAVQGLNSKYRTDLGGIVSGFIGANANPDDVNNALDEYAKQNPDALPAVHWTENLVDHLGNTQDPGQKDQALSHLSATLQGESATTPGTINLPQGVQPVAVNRFGLGATPEGQSFATGLGPTDQPGYRAAVASATSRATGMAGIDVTRADDISRAVQPSAAAIPQTLAIDDLADQIHSGKFAAEISKGAAAVGLSNETYARQILTKDLGQVQTRATDFGNPTDKKLGTILSGFPEATSDPQTIHTAMDYIRGSFRQNIARSQNLQSYRQQHPDLTGLQQSDDQLTTSVDPLTAEFKSLNPQQRTSFYQRNFKTPEEAQAFKNKALGSGQ